MQKQLVVVTGGSGFIAIHIILQLLQRGYAVRATVRSLNKQALIETMLRNGGLTDLSDLSLIEADLSHDRHWAAAMQGASYVMHVASPTPKLQFKDEAEMIKPAVDGVLRVLTAARDAHVKRVVLTSAYGAVFAGHPQQRTPFTETDWSDLTVKHIHPYQKSKTLAERAAWDFIKREGHGMTLAAINPVGVMGPVLASTYFHSNIQIQELLAGKVPAVPHIDSGYVDVRDVAQLHMLAMTSPKAAGERFLATTGETLSMLDVANSLRSAYPQYASRLPKHQLPNVIVKTAAIFQPNLRMLASLVGGYAETSNAKAQCLLDWHPRSAKTAILATAQSMFDLNLIKPV
ncbi:SDR family oxidoreductase [Lactiplantibacillus songbeiensis]|uniref:SDR family oxidoreductase n=1 Tax=Lactiplantibacillus songbeiensis TaxID=2559920 RepID=A0ABW4C189_9LACO|nr:aldehyde reductase [Lactiplantibacillus songbeiensis]